MTLVSPNQIISIFSANAGQLAASGKEVFL